MLSLVGGGRKLSTRRFWSTLVQCFVDVVVLYDWIRRGVSTNIVQKASHLKTSKNSHWFTSYEEAEKK